MIAGVMVIVWEEFVIVIQVILEIIVNHRRTFCAKVRFQLFILDDGYCSGHGKCNNGKCLCDIEYKGEICN
jgi:hypothetical protein